MSNFCFSHNVFKSSLWLMCQNEYLCSKGLLESQLLQPHLKCRLPKCSFWNGLKVCLLLEDQRNFFFTTSYFRAFLDSLSRGAGILKGAHHGLWYPHTNTRAQHNTLSVRGGALYTIIHGNRYRFENGKTSPKLVLSQAIPGFYGPENEGF